jgi:HlyD family secretion protein
MASGELGAVLKSVETLFTVGTSAGLTDVQLLDRYVGRSDDGAEAAFTALVKRHGPMVLRVCRGELNDRHTAEDAFQATFLILARKARSIRKGGSLASWLYGVARRVARRARADRLRRIAHERQGALMADHPSLTVHNPTELLPEIQEEVDRLPGKYRAPIILCYLEGLTHEEAANQLRIPVGTVKIRLSRGRERLRGRLVRRGLAPTLIASALSASTRGAVPVPLLDMTVKAAMHVAAVRAAGVSVAVTALVEGVLRTMFLSKLRTIAGLLATSMMVIATSILAVSGLPRPVRSDQVLDAPKVEALVQSPQKAAATQTPDKPEVGKTLTVKKSVFHRTTSQPANVAASNSVEVYPKVSGYIKAVNVDIGDSVKAGDKLVVIDAPELRYELDKAKAMVRQSQARLMLSKSRIREAEAASKTVLAQIAAAEAEVKQAEASQTYREKQLKRIKELVERRAVEERLALEEEDHLRTAQAASFAARANVIVEKANLSSTEAKIETARAELLESQADLSLVTADLEKAQAAVDSCEIRSPIGGVVTRCNYQGGEFARAATTAGSQPLLTIVYAKAVWIVTHVPDDDAPYLDVGDPITFRATASPDREYKGTITRTAFAEDPTTQSLMARISLDNADGRLRPGQVGSVTIHLEDHPNVITIPRTAIFGQGYSRLLSPIGGPVSCYRMVDGHPRRTPIRLGGGDSGVVEVLDGLKEGDTILPDWRVNDPNPAAGIR